MKKNRFLFPISHFSLNHKKKNYKTLQTQVKLL